MNTVNNLQTNIADILIWIEPWGNELWFTLGVFFVVTLSTMVIFSYYKLPLTAEGVLKDIYIFLRSESAFYLALVFCIFLLRLPGLSRLEANPDESGLIAGAFTLLIDPRFWISVDNTTIGPLSTFSLTLIPLFGLTINYGTVKLLGVLIWILSALLMYRAFVNFYDKRIAKLALLPFILCVSTFTNWDFVAYNGEHVPVILLATCVYFLSRLYANRESQSSALFLGIFLGLIPFAKVQAAPIGLAFGVVVFVYLILRKDKRYITLALGALLPLFFTLIYLIASGAFPDFWQSYILNNLKYASEGFFSQTRSLTFFEKVATIPEFLYIRLDTRLFFITHFFISITLLVLLFLMRKSLEMSDRWLIFLSSILVLISLFSVILPGNNWTHYLLLLVVPLTFLFGISIGTYSRVCVPNINHAKKTNISLVIVSLIVFITSVVPSVYVMLDRNVAFEEAIANSKNGKNISEESKKMLEYAEPGERMAVWGFFLEHYVETGFAQGTREGHSERQLDKSPQQEYYINRWISDIKKNKPPILVESMPTRWADYKFENYPGVKAVIEESYQLIAKFENPEEPPYRIYVSKQRLSERGINP